MDKSVSSAFILVLLSPKSSKEHMKRDQLSMLKQAPVDHYRFQHQLTGKMSRGWKHEALGGGVSKTKTLTLKVLQHQVILRYADYSPLPCLRIS